jgi:hypothetical protein
MILIDKFYLEPVTNTLSVDDCRELLSCNYTEFLSTLCNNYDYNEGNFKKATNVKCVFFQMVEKQKDFQMNESKNIIIAKQHINGNLFCHLMNMSFIYFIRRDLDTALAYFPKNFDFFKYRLCLTFQFQMMVLMSPKADENAMIKTVEKFTSFLLSDNFVTALSEKENVSPELKVKEILMKQLALLRSQLASKLCPKYNYLIRNVLNPMIVCSYTFVHHDPSKHEKFLDIVKIIKNDSEDYHRKQIELALLNSHSERAKISFADIIYYFSKQDHITDEIWKVLFCNMDKIIKVTSHRMGFICLIKLFVKLEPTIKKRDNRYHWLLQMRKLAINLAYKYHISDLSCETFFDIKLYFKDKYDMDTQCICCFEDFEDRISICFVCLTCNCSYCEKCARKMHRKCAQCRKSGRVRNALKGIGLDVGSFIFDIPYFQ